MAEQGYRRLLHEHPAYHAHVYNNLALLLHSTFPDEAKAIWLEGVKRFPDDEVLQNNMELILSRAS